MHQRICQYKEHSRSASEYEHIYNIYYVLLYHVTKCKKNHPFKKETDCCRSIIINELSSRKLENDSDCDGPMQLQ